MMYIQTYFQKQILWPLFFTLIAFVLLALMTQGLSRFDLIINQNQNISVFLAILILTTPQLIVYILPITLFVSVIYSYNKLYTDRELIIAQASGLGYWQLSMPAIRITLVLMIIHLFINLWVQPASYRTMRHMLHEIKADLTTSLIKPGQFIHPEPGLTIFSNEVSSNGVLKNILIHDFRKNEHPITFTAQSGILSDIKRQPVITMYNGTIQRIEPDSSLSFLNFESYTFNLNTLELNDHLLIYKTSDRYIYELLFPNIKDHWQAKNKASMISEGHYRLSSPLYNLALCLIALGSIFIGNFKRTGYTNRISIAAACAIATRLLGIYAQSIAEKNPTFNFLQYLIPLSIIFLMTILIYHRQRFFKNPKNYLNRNEV